MTQSKFEKSINQLHTATEDNHYWKQQVERCKTSELNHKAFCRLSDLNYNHFQYWYRKFEGVETPKPPVSAVPIKFKLDKSRFSSPLCSIQLATGATLYLHDIALVESLMKGAL